MPKAIRYKSNSVIYFSGDVADRVFLLNNGHVALTSIDIETGKQVTEYIKTGEFFGVKSVLGNYPREESAMVLTDSVVYAFSPAEFENFAQSNTRIILQMIKVFSKQLRKIHKQLQILSSDENNRELNPDDGMYSVAVAFANSQHFTGAVEVANRYKSLFPNGKNLQGMNELIFNATGKKGLEFGVASQDAGPVFIEPSDTKTDNFDLAQEALKKAISAEASGDCSLAYDNYHTALESGVPNVVEVASIGAARCLYKQKEYVRCVQLLTTFVSNNSKSAKISEALFYLGLCYEGLVKPDKAIAFYNKAALIASPELLPKIKERQQACGGVQNG
ncbi:MAG: hypothetical protein CR988_06460 [Treponema sp.]|nr:MAG: hypothetical protein CR988_06460 [Treponema sp.]